MPVEPPTTPCLPRQWRRPPKADRAGRCRDFLGAALLALLSVVLVGCATPGDPTPRRPVIPLPVTDLMAHQTGDAVVLTFTLPTNSTEQESLAEPPAVEIYRKPAAASAPAAKNGKSLPSAPLADTIPGSSVAQYQKEGHVEFPDPLDPGDLAREPGRQLVYIVRTRASRARASTDSNPVTLRVYPPPPPVNDLRVTITETALELAWTAAQPPPGATTIGYRIYRTEIAPDTLTAAIQNLSQATLLAPLTLLSQATASEYRDTNVAFGHTYAYTVRAVAQFGPDLVESADSAAALVAAKDIFPPAIPQGLEAVVTPASPGAQAYVELAWNLSTEPDLAGYSVYRSEEQGARGERLNTGLSTAPTFRDLTAMPGRRYFYKVTAVDRAGNESAPSSEVAAEVPGP
jgi:hypothetical protein